MFQAQLKAGPRVLARFVISGVDLELQILRLAISAAGLGM